MPDDAGLSVFNHHGWLVIHQEKQFCVFNHHALEDHELNSKHKRKENTPRTSKHIFWVALELYYRHMSAKTKESVFSKKGLQGPFFQRFYLSEFHEIFKILAKSVEFGGTL